MEIREIFDTIESDPNMDKELQDSILKSLDNIAKADELIDGLEAKIVEHKEELSDKELKYIINKCISYKNIFYKFRNGGIIDFDHLNEITRRIFELEESIRTNDFHIWKEELIAYKGSKRDKEEEKMLKNMLMVVPEEQNVVDRITRMFKRAIWKMKQKTTVNTSKEVIELPQTNGIDDLNYDEMDDDTSVKLQKVEDENFDNDDESKEQK